MEFLIYSLSNLYCNFKVSHNFSYMCFLCVQANVAVLIYNVLHWHMVF
jgi:hypothetical protein